MMFDNAIQQALAVKDKAETAIVKLGTVTAVSNGRAVVQHYGESNPSTKKYTTIDGYFPVVGDKVAMLPQGNTYIIIGKVIDTAPVEKYATIEHVDEVAEGLLPIAYKNKLEDSEHSTESLTFSDYVLLPTTNDKDILGSSSKYFKEAYINKLYLNGTAYTEISMDRITVKSGNTTYSLIATVSNSIVNLTPSTNDKWILGSKSYQLKEAWLGLFRGSWKSGNTTERQVAWDSSNALVPDTNNSVDLGNANYTFKQLFLNALVGAKFQYQSGSTYNIAWANASDIQPNAADVVNLGASGKQFNKVYAKEFYINGTKLDISGITTDNLVTKYGTIEYKLTLSIKNASSAERYEALEPSVSEKFDLGSNSYKFRNIYLTTWAYSSSRNISWDANSNIIPDTTNAVSLGTALRQYKNVYGQNLYVNGTAVSSDRNLKKDIKVLDDRYVEFFKALKPVSYRFKDGTSGRKHTGFIAQEVEEAAEESGLTVKDLAVVVKDLTPGTEEERYYLRYEEIIAVQTKVIQDLMARVDTLEARINKLENERSKT